MDDTPKPPPRSAGWKADDPKQVPAGHAERYPPPLVGWAAGNEPTLDRPCLDCRNEGKTAPCASCVDLLERHARAKKLRDEENSAGSAGTT